MYITNTKYTYRSVANPADRLLAVRGNHDGSWGEAVNGVYYLKHIGAGKLYNEIYRRQAQDGQRVFGGDGNLFLCGQRPP